MQHPGSGLYMATSAPSSAAPSVAGSAYSPANSVINAQSTMRPPLPNRNVDVNSIEEAYVSFVLACNPAVPSGADTTALREAFRTPPRSDGRSFSIYTLYLLIRELEERILKTWAELALKLGVEPPDQEKGQSSQKIQQYAVRLKRWMHSMHVDAFFDYLMGRSHPYWTEIPPENYPISEILRDGVAAKDDMALRALIPEIKPRRGRKRDDESDSDYTSGRDPQRQRLDNYTDDIGRWTGAQTPGNPGGMFGYASSQQQLSPTDGTMRASPPWGNGPDAMGTQMAHGGFWGEESKPAVAPSAASSGRRPGRRHGAKVVSSAWRSNGSGGSGKTRGRPPINRAGNHHALTPNHDGSFPPVSVIERTTPTFPPQTTSSYLPHMQSTASISPLPTSAATTHSELSAMGTSGGTSGILPPPVPQSAYLTGADSPPVVSQRGGRHGNYSHHISDRKGADVRLAAPHMHGMHSAMMSGGPGVGMHVTDMSHAINPTMANIALNSYGASQLGMPPNMSLVPPELMHGSHSHSPMGGMHGMSATPGAPSVTSDAAASYSSEPVIDSTHKPGEGKNAPTEPSKPPMYQSRFGSGSPNDRTNIDELEAFFMTEIFAATWYDENDNRIAPCSVEEATALVEIIINDLTKAAASKEAFLINLAALAGGKILMANTDVRVKRLEKTAEHTKYDCSWELRYGDVRGQFSIQEAVPHAHWKKLTNDVKASVARAVGLAGKSTNTTSQHAPGPSANAQDRNSAFPIYNAAHINTTGRIDSPMLTTGGGHSMHFTDPSTASSGHSINFGMPSNAATPTSSAAGSAGNLSDENAALAALWERKYRHVLHLLYKRDQQLDRTRASVLRGLQKTYHDDDSLDI